MPYPQEDLARVQEAALLAGAGILYGSPSYSQFKKWPENRKKKWSTVLNVVNQFPALWPKANRKRIPTASEGKSYAMLRAQSNSKKKMLLIFNFEPKQIKIKIPKIDLSKASVGIFNNLKLSGTKENAEIALPAYGFEFSPYNDSN